MLEDAILAAKAGELGLEPKKDSVSPQITVDAPIMIPEDYVPDLAVRMLALQFGNRSHVLIGALAATSGAGLWAAAGGLIGWTLALLPFLAFGPALAARRPVQGLRYASAAILALWGVRAGLSAFGL